MTDEGREIRAVGRYEWEQIIRRARLGAVIGASGRRGKQGKQTKGRMSGTTFTGIALGWATYANDRGQEIWPGDATVAIDLETSIDAVRKVRKALLSLGLLKRVANRTATRGVEYRLTLPSDLLENLDVLTPAQHKLAASRLREAARGHRRGESAGSPSDESLGIPPDHPEDEPGVSTGPASGESPGGSAGPPEPEPGWSGGHALGGPVDTHTDHDRTTSSTTDHSGDDLRTELAVTRAREAESTTQNSPPDDVDPPRLRIVTGGQAKPPPNGHRQAALWPAPVPSDPTDAGAALESAPEVPTPVGDPLQSKETDVKADEAKAQIRATLAGHRPAPLRRYSDRPKPNPAHGEQPRPKLDADRVAALGFCVTCYRSGKVIASVAGADGCRAHMSAAGVA